MDVCFIGNMAECFTHARKEVFNSLVYWPARFFRQIFEILFVFACQMFAALLQTIMVYAISDVCSCSSRIFLIKFATVWLVSPLLLIFRYWRGEMPSSRATSEWLPNIFANFLKSVFNILRHIGNYCLFVNNF